MLNAAARAPYARRQSSVLAIKTPTIDVDALRRHRELLAQAATVEASGCALTLPASLWGDAKAVQDQRLEYDPWIDKLVSL